LLGGGNVAVYADPRTWKSTLLSQLDFHEENGITHRIVICPRAKMGGWVRGNKILLQEEPYSLGLALIWEAA
jgi:hypothetical protein